MSEILTFSQSWPYPASAHWLMKHSGGMALHKKKKVAFGTDFYDSPQRYLLNVLKSMLKFIMWIIFSLQNSA